MVSRKSKGANGLFRYLQWLVAFINASMFIFLVYKWFLHETIDTPPMTRADYLDLSLSLLNAMLATLGIGLAIIGFVGYSSLKQAAENKADEVARSVVQAYLRGPERAENVRVNQVRDSKVQLADPVVDAEAEGDI